MTREEFAAHFGSAVRFGIVGLAGTALYAAIAYGTLALGWHVLASHVVAFGISIFASYLGQKIFTFGIRGDHQRSGPRFIIATIFLASTQALLVFCLERAGVADRITLLASMLFYPPASYLLHTFWTFRQPKQT